jgi:hypothetical protein
LPRGGPVHRRLAGEESPEPRPTDEDTVEINPLGQAEWEGHSIGSDGILGNAPAHYSLDEQAAWTRGHAVGFRMYEDEEMSRWATDAAGPVVIHHAELAEAGGIEFARDYR